MSSTSTLTELGLINLDAALGILNLNGINDPDARQEALSVARRISAPQPLPAIGYDGIRLQRWCEGDL